MVLYMKKNKKSHSIEERKQKRAEEINIYQEIKKQWYSQGTTNPTLQVKYIGGQGIRAGTKVTMAKFTASKIKMVVWNSRGIKGKKAELVKRFEETDIIILTETKAQQEGLVRFSGFKTVSKQSQGCS